MKKKLTYRSWKRKLWEHALRVEIKEFTRIHKDYYLNNGDSWKGFFNDKYSPRDAYNEDRGLRNQ